jgi:hypothetical protein
MVGSPILSAILAIAAAWLAISFDRRKTVNQQLIRKRIAIYDEMAPKLDDILCFFFLVGDFRKLPPSAMIAHERRLDRTINVYLPIFSPTLKTRYDAFIDVCFLPFGGGSGRPALIRADRERLAGEWGKKWNADRDGGFVDPARASDLELILRHYEALMGQLAREVGVGDRGRLSGARPAPRPGRISGRGQPVRGR